MTPGLARVSSIGGANMLSTTLAMWRPGGEAEGRSASRPSRRPRTPIAFLALAAVGCAHSPPPPSLTRNLDREEFEQAVRFKNPSVVTVMALANHTSPRDEMPKATPISASEQRRSPTG